MKLVCETMILTEIYCENSQNSSHGWNSILFCVIYMDFDLQPFNSIKQQQLIAEGKVIIDLKDEERDRE